MKAIILAAGPGTRLEHLTKNSPKAMLRFRGKPILEHHIERYFSEGVNNVSIVKGYMAKKIKFKNVNYYLNKNYKTTNMVESLFCAEKEMNDDIIISYGDILFEKQLLKKIIECKKDICVAVDDNWQKYWKARFDNNLKDIESLQIGKDGSIVEVGTPDVPEGKCQARYIGLLKFSKKGTGILKKVYHENKKKYWNKEEKWLNSKSFKRAYMTDILQAIINAGYKIWPVHTSSGWLEFDTVQDSIKADEWLKNGTIKRFFSFEK